MSPLGKSAEQRPVGIDWQEHRLKHEDRLYVRFKVVQAVSPPFSFREAAIAWARKQGLIGEMTPAETGNKGRILISVGTKIEVLAETIGNGLSDTAPNTNTSTTNQAKELPDLTADILLNGVCDVNGESFL